jgi:PST family polysaccharide transporter
MKSIFKATAILGSSSAIGAVVGIVSAKMWAITVGPAGIGYLSMQLSVLGLVTLIAGLGIGAGIVRLGAKAIAEDDKLGIAANQKAVIVISLAAGIVGVLILFVFGDPINRTFLDDKSSGREVAALGIALIFSLLTSAFTSILNAHQNVKALAKFTVISNTLGKTI